MTRSALPPPRPMRPRRLITRSRRHRLAWRHHHAGRANRPPPIAPRPIDDPPHLHRARRLKHRTGRTQLPRRCAKAGPEAAAPATSATINHSLRITTSDYPDSRDAKPSFARCRPIVLNDPTRKDAMPNCLPDVRSHNATDLQNSRPLRVESGLTAWMTARF